MGVKSGKEPFYDHVIKHHLEQGIHLQCVQSLMFVCLFVYKPHGCLFVSLFNLFVLIDGSLSFYCLCVTWTINY